MILRLSWPPQKKKLRKGALTDSGSDTWGGGGGYGKGGKCLYIFVFRLYCGELGEVFGLGDPASLGMLKGINPLFLSVQRRPEKQ